MVWLHWLLPDALSSLAITRMLDIPCSARRPLYSVMYGALHHVTHVRKTTGRDPVSGFAFDPRPVASSRLACRISACDGPLLLIFSVSYPTTSTAHANPWGSAAELRWEVSPPPVPIVYHSSSLGATTCFLCYLYVLPSLLLCESIAEI